MFFILSKHVQSENLSSFAYTGGKTVKKCLINSPTKACEITGAVKVLRMQIRALVCASKPAINAREGLLVLHYTLNCRGRNDSLNTDRNRPLITDDQ